MISHHGIDPSYSISETPSSPAFPVTPALTERDEVGTEAARKWVNECPMRLSETQLNHLISILDCGLDRNIRYRESEPEPCFESCNAEDTQAVSELASPNLGNLKELPQVHWGLDQDKTKLSISNSPERHLEEVSAWGDRYDNLMALSQRLSVTLMHLSKSIPIPRSNQPRRNVTYDTERLVSSTSQSFQDRAAPLPVIEPWRLDTNGPGDVAFNNLGSSSQVQSEINGPLPTCGQ